MIEPEPVQYAQVGDAYVAYRCAGRGPHDLVLLIDWFGHAEELWSEVSPYRPILERLGSFARLITFDQRGVGLSDPVPAQEQPSLAHWHEDLRAVLDACGVDAAHVVAKGSAGALAVRFAAREPQRVRSLVFVNSYARLLADHDYPFGVPAEYEPRLTQDNYPPPGSVRDLAGPAADERSVVWMDRYFRMAASPRTTGIMRRMLFRVDVRDQLAAVQAPTLVIHRRDDGWIVRNHGRYLAQHITGARYVELAGVADMLFGDDPFEITDEIEEYVAGTRSAGAATRVLRTIVFTDLVDSTRRLADAGDRSWRATLGHHEHVVRAQLTRFGGREVTTTGDGFVAVFEGPARAVQCALAVCRALEDAGLPARAGVHAGEIELHPGGDISGIVVHVAARIQALATPGEVLVSRTIKDLVAGSALRFADRGEHELKGVPDRWRLYAADAPA